MSQQSLTDFDTGEQSPPSLDEATNPQTTIGPDSVGELMPDDPAALPSDEQMHAKTLARRNELLGTYGRDRLKSALVDDGYSMAFTERDGIGPKLSGNLQDVGLRDFADLVVAIHSIRMGDDPIMKNAVNELPDDVRRSLMHSAESAASEVMAPLAPLDTESTEEAQEDSHPPGDDESAIPESAVEIVSPYRPVPLSALKILRNDPDIEVYDTDRVGDPGRQEVLYLSATPAEDVMDDYELTVSEE